MTVEDACLILNVDQNNLSEEALRHAFSNAAHLSHPDSNPNNAYAKTKFAMIQEAYMVLKGYVFEMPKNKTQEDYYEDPWVKYNEADKKFNNMKKEETKRRTQEAFSKYQNNETKHSYSKNTHKVAQEESKSAAVAYKSVENTPAIGYKMKNMYLLFLQSDLIFDCILAGSIALMILFHAINLNFVIIGWMTSILLSRRLAKFVWKESKNIIVSGVFFLIGVEAFVELMKLLLL